MTKRTNTPTDKLRRLIVPASPRRKPKGQLVRIARPGRAPQPRRAR